MISDKFIAPATAAAGYALDIATTDWRYGKQREQQRKLTADQLRASKEMAKYQNELAFDIWQKTNFSAQRAELEKAGLNPALMYAKGAGAGGQLVSSGGGAQGGIAGTPDGGMGMQIAQIASQIELTKAQARLANTQADKTAGIDTELASMEKVIKEFTGKELKDFYELVSTPNRGIQSKTFGDELEARQAVASNIYELWKEGKLKEKSEAEIVQILTANAKNDAEKNNIIETLNLIKENTKGKSLENILTEIETTWAETLGLRSGDATQTATKIIDIISKLARKQKNVPLPKTNKK